MHRLLPIIPFILLSCTKDPVAPANGSAMPELPERFGTPEYDFAANPPTAAGVALGKRLFYDPILSRDSSVSCASCHQPAAAFADGGRALSIGIDGQVGKRNAPALQNLAWKRSFFWDGGVFHLDLVPLAPIANPLEMNEVQANVLTKIRRHDEYPALFEAAFGTRDVKPLEFLQAISQFMVQFVSAGSPYDRFATGDATALSADEQAGLGLFRVHCQSCHGGEQFSDGKYRNNGLDSVPGADRGRYEVSLLDADRGRFRVPGLRNVAVSAPYMHDGRLPTLEAVLDHYAGGVQNAPTLDPLLRRPDGALGIPLTGDEKRLIIKFLGALTDDGFLNNPALRQE